MQAESDDVLDECQAGIPSDTTQALYEKTHLLVGLEMEGAPGEITKYFPVFRPFGASLWLSKFVPDEFVKLPTARFVALRVN
jgi:hypothetical protein